MKSNVIAAALILLDTATRADEAARYAVGSMLGEATRGKLAGLAVFNRALADAEMLKLHEEARVGGLK